MAKQRAAALKVLGLRIQELRRGRGFTQEAMAERLGMLTPNYARIEQGRMNVTVDTLLRITNSLGVELLELFRAPKTKVARPGRPRSTR